MHDLPIESLFKELNSSVNGLSDEEAAKRLAEHGPNRLQTETKIKPLLILLNQFKNFIIYILLFAVVFSLVIGEYLDSIIILAILTVNAAIGFFQELSANRSLEALKKMSKVRARVARDGTPREIDGEELVPGDVIFLEAGDKIPADARVIEAVALKAEEASLTGESLPVNKSPAVLSGCTLLGDRVNMLHASTSIVAGNCRALVTTTGMETEIGKITGMLRETKEEPTPLQKRLDAFGHKLGVAILLICLFIFIMSLGKEYFAGTITAHILMEYAFIAISLAVAAVPTALPAVVTIALSIGVKRLLRKKALVRKLSSVETLGSCDVICTDKTGTLTQNQMTTRLAWVHDRETEISGAGYATDGSLSRAIDPLLFDIGRHCNNSRLLDKNGIREVYGDPTEAALLVSAAKAGLDPDERTGERIGELPFDSERKMMSVLLRSHSQYTIYTKGAPDAILERCDRILINGEVQPLNESNKKTVLAKNASYAGQALRVLGFAMARVAGENDFREENLIFVGLQAMMDPPRPEVAASISRTTQAGIRVIMITGDYPDTASAVGREIGITGRAVSGCEFEAMSDEELTGALKGDVNIFARVAPEHKQRIVETLQRLGHTVAMTGDGVNDAPALKKANIGVAVGSGTDVAKEAADFVLLDDSFTHIVNAIEEGRGIYDNIQKSIMLLLSGNLGEVLIIFIAVILGFNLPLTAILLLWINMVTDGAPALAYSVDPYGRAIMRHPPKPRDEGILPVPKLRLIGFMGMAGTLIALTLFSMYGGRSGQAEELMTARTMAFNFVVLYELILTFVIRLDYGVPFWSNRWIWTAVLVSLALQCLLMYTPLHVLFKITPLQGAEIMALLLSGLCFYGLFLVYRLTRDAKAA